MRSVGCGQWSTEVRNDRQICGRMRKEIDFHWRTPDKTSGDRRGDADPVRECRRRTRMSEEVLKELFGSVRHSDYEYYCQEWRQNGTEVLQRSQWKKRYFNAKFLSIYSDLLITKLMKVDF